MEEQEAQAPVLATCSIRSPVEAFENTQSRLLLLAASEEEYDRKRSPAYLHKGVTYTVLGILTCIRRLTGLCHEGLPHHFVAWTKSDTTSLLLVALTDQARSKSELVAENAFLRKPRIILRRRMIQPACTKTDGMILVFWRRRAGTWKDVLFIVMGDDAYPLVVSEYDSSVLLPLRNCCCTKGTMKIPQAACILA